MKSTIPLNNPKKNTKFTSRFIISLLCGVTYIAWFEVFLIFHLLVTHYLSHICIDITHVLICSKHQFIYVLNTSSYLKSIHHSNFYTHQFSPVSHSFPSLALYPHGLTEGFEFVVPYANVSDISQFYQPHIIYYKVLHHIGRMTCDSQHNFTSIQGIECVTNCLNFCSLWEVVCTYIFSISDCVCRSDFFSSKKHSYNAPTSSVDEIQRVSHLSSCRFYTLVHDHGVHDLFIKTFIQKQLIQLIQVNINIC